MLTIHRSKGLEFRRRLRPVPVGADVGRREADPDRLPRPRRGLPAHDRRRPRRPGLQAPQGPARLRAARRGPAARVRRADPRQAPGRRLVGGLVEQPRLGAQPAAVRPRRRGQRRGLRPAAAVRRGRDRPLPRARLGRAGLRQRRAHRRPRPAGRLVRPAHRVPPRSRPATFARELDRRWRRTSYSDITAASHEARVASEPEERVLDDEPEPPAVRARRLDALPLGAIPGGVAVRHVRARGAGGDRLRRGRPRRRADATGRGGARAAAGRRRDARRPVVAGLRAALETPLGPLVGGLRLRDVTRARPARRARLRAAAGRRRRARRAGHAGRDRRRAARAPRARRSAGRRTPTGSRIPSCASSVRGYLTGSIDLVLRAGDRFAVVDYKTNWLGGPGEELRRGALPPGRAGRRDGARALPPAGAALHGGAAPLPALAAARLRPRPAPGRRAVPVRARDDRRARSPACSPGGRRPRSSSRSATCWTRGGGVIDDRSTSAARSIAPGLLREFNDIGVLAAADVHVAARLAALAGEADEAVTLAAALAVRAPRLGHVYVDLATIGETAAVDADEPVDLSALPWPEPDEWVRRVAASPLVAVGEDGAGEPPAAARRLRPLPRPLLARGTPGRRRPARARRRGVGRRVPPRRRPRPPVRRRGTTGQRRAAATAVRRRFAVVAGGPGTGKTTTVARIVALLAEQAGAMPLVALAAPTGKAAARLEEAVHAEARTLDVDAVHPRRAAQPRRVDAAPPARLAAGQPQPVPAPPRQPAAARRRDRRRDVDGVAVADGAGGRGGPARGAARAGRRPRPADVDRGRRRARGHRRRRRARRRGARARVPLRRGDRRARVRDPRGRRRRGDRRARPPATTTSPGSRSTPAIRRRWTRSTPVREGAVAAAQRRLRRRPRRRRARARSTRWAPTACCARTAAAGTASRCGRRGSRAGSANEIGRGPWYPGRPLLVTENDYGLRLYNGDTGVVVADRGRARGGRVRAPRRAGPVRAVAAVGDRDGVRDDRPQEPGLAVRHRRRAAADARRRRSSPASCSTRRSPAPAGI